MWYLFMYYVVACIYNCTFVTKTRPLFALTPSFPHRELSAKKQEAQALMSEMECTAQAFEEMQEQNIRLLQHLKVRTLLISYFFHSQCLKIRLLESILTSLQSYSPPFPSLLSLSPLPFASQEKDDANFKLMSERIKSNSVQKLLVEEKDLMQSQLTAQSTEKARLVT